MTPNRPEATCLIAERRSGSMRRSGSSPPSPVLERAAEPVHRDGEGLVGLHADRAVAHRPGVEPLDDLADRLDLLDRHAAARLGAAELEEPAQRHQALGLLVDARGVLLEDVVAPLPASRAGGGRRCRGRTGAARPRGATGTRRRRRACGAPGGCRRAGTPAACRAAVSAAMTSRPDPAELAHRAGEVARRRAPATGRSPRRPARRGRTRRWRCPSSTSP